MKIVLNDSVKPFYYVIPDENITMDNNLDRWQQQCWASGMDDIIGHASKHDIANFLHLD